MLPISYLYNREIGTSVKCGLRPCDLKLNIDFLLSRLTCLRKDAFLVYGEETDVPPFACKFRRDSQHNLLAVANEDGDILLYDTSDSCSQSLLKTFRAHHNAVFDLCWLPDKCQLIASSGDHRASLWDMTSCSFLSSFRRHTASIKSVDVCHEQSAIFATGSKDGTINIWDTRQKNSVLHEKPAITICCAHCRKYASSGRKRMYSDSVSSVSSVAFQDCNNLASSGVADGIVKVWDLRKTYVSHSKYTPLPKYQMSYSESKNMGQGCTSLVFNSTYRFLYASTTGNKIFKFDCHSYDKDAVIFEGFRCSTYFVKIALSSDDQYLLSGSSDDKAYIWKTSKPGLPILQLPGHAAEVTSVTWSPHDNSKLVTCGDDNKVLIWRMANLENIDNEEVLATASPYSECSKNASPLSSDTDQSLITDSSTQNKSLTRSSLESFDTPSKPAIRVITNFFSPVTPISPISSSSTNTQWQFDVPVKAIKLQNRSPVGSPSQVLTPSNHANKSSILHSSENNLEKQPSPIDKNSATSLISSSSGIQNKENTESESSPESFSKTNNLSQTKRKSNVKHSTPRLKKMKSDKGSKVKGFVRTDKKVKITPGKTIMNYFSVVFSSEN